MSRLGLALGGVVLALGIGCGGGDPAVDPDGDAGPTDALDVAPDTPAPEVAASCPTGHVAGPSAGGCMAVGVRGCAPDFIAADGLCRPSIDTCEPGTIPAFETGCVPVGIRGCAAEFIAADGLCRPSLEACAAGTIPAFETGCQPVGITACAEDFIGDDGLCHPTMAACPAGTFAVPSAGCVSIDGPDGCGDGVWGHVPLGADAVYVDPAYAGGDSDGSPDNPWTLVGQALSQVPAGGRIVLAAGDYAQPVVLGKSAQLVGRCASLVTIRATNKPTQPGIEVKGPVEVAIRGVTVTAPGVGIVVHSGAAAAIERVRISAANVVGVLVFGDGTSATLERSLIEQTVPMGGTAGVGWGVGVNEGATGTLVGNALIGNLEAGLSIQDPGTRVVASDNLVEGTLGPQLAADASAGIWVWGGAEATLTDNALVANQGSALLVQGLATAADVSHNLIEGAVGAPDGRLPAGVEVRDRAASRLYGNAIIANAGAGVVVFDDATLEAQGNLIAAGTAIAGADFGLGIEVHTGGAATLLDNAIVANRNAQVAIVDGGTAELGRNVIGGAPPPGVADQVAVGVLISVGEATLADNALVGTHDIAVWAADEGTRLHASHNLLAESRDTPGDEPVMGVGLEVAFGAWAESDGNALVANQAWGVKVVGEGTVLEATGDLIAGPGETSKQPRGAGILVTQGASATISGSTLYANEGVSLQIRDEGTAVDAGWLLIEDTWPHAPVHDIGRGITLELGARLTLADSAIIDSYNISLAIVSAAEAQLEALLVGPTRSVVPPASEYPFDAPPFAVGVHVGFGSTASLTGSLVEDSLGAGVTVFDSEAVVVDSAIRKAEAGLFLLPDESYATSADGIMSTGGSVDLEGLAVDGCARAGIVLHQSAGRLSRSWARNNAYGLVVQSSPEVVVDADNRFFGNAEGGAVGDVGLEVPDSELESLGALD